VGVQQPHVGTTHQVQWRWHIGGRDAGYFLEDVLPHLRVKFEAARAAIPVLLATKTNRRLFTPSEVVERQALVAVLRATNAGKAGRKKGGGSTDAHR
jgi:hypothetical protein